MTHVCPLSGRPTPAQLSALKWLVARGGDGVFTGRGKALLLARGEVAPVMRATWNRLRVIGLIDFYGRHRCRVSPAGRRIDLSGVAESVDTTGGRAGYPRLV